MQQCGHMMRTWLYERNDAGSLNSYACADVDESSSVTTASEARRLFDLLRNVSSRDTASLQEGQERLDRILIRKYGC